MTSHFPTFRLSISLQNILAILPLPLPSPPLRLALMSFRYLSSPAHSGAISVSTCRHLVVLFRFTPPGPSLPSRIHDTPVPLPSPADAPGHPVTLYYTTEQRRSERSVILFSAVQLLQGWGRPVHFLLCCDNTRFGEGYGRRSIVNLMLCDNVGRPDASMTRCPNATF